MGYLPGMGAVRFGPSGLPSRDTPEQALALLQADSFDACEIDFPGGFWMSWEFAEHLGELTRLAGIELSIHAPIAAFLGHGERGRKLNMAVGMLDHSAGIAHSCGARLVVIHPGFLLGRPREQAIEDVVEQLGEVRDRLEAKGRATPFGIEVMGRVSELGSIEDCLEIASRFDWTRPVLDFAHMHATTDGAFTSPEQFGRALEMVDAILPPGEPFHIHFSDIAFANRNEKKHLPYGQGTLRAEPLAEALERFERSATIISESPDEESHRSIQRALAARR